jgi:hypothetical protein
MSKEGYLALAISILVILLVVFIVSFVIYMKTPAPKGCENIKISEENCANCNHSECSFYKERNEK